MLNAIPHRHTHRGAFSPGPLPPRLLVGLQHDALAEGAALALVQSGIDYERLASLLSATGPKQDRDPVARADVARWSRTAASAACDGVPALASRRSRSASLAGLGSGTSTWDAESGLR